jgi:ubiquinone biosynthesis protein COQ9
MTDLIPPVPASRSEPLRESILDTALNLGEQRGWDAVHLHDIAHILGITLADIGRQFSQKDAIAEAWFDRADAAMLAAPESARWAQQSVQQRLHEALFFWFGALSAHRDLTAQMLRYKLQPEHVHLQVLGAMRVSRTVQWWREAALLPSAGWRREVEEAALTAIYLSTFTYWLRDNSHGARRTHAWLRRQLTMVGRASQWLMVSP